MRSALTPNQASAVERISGDLVIRAGAGSGKTTVLARRFVQGLLPHASGEAGEVDVDQILTITFTAKAAAEVADRVRTQMNSSISADAGRRVGEAWISTIHRLCGRLVRRHALEAGVEPGFALADEVQSAMLQAEAFEIAATKLLREGTDGEAAFSAYPYDSAFESIRDIHENVRAMGLDPETVSIPSGREALEDAVAEAIDCARHLVAVLAECSQTESVRTNSEAISTYGAELAACSLDDPDCARVREVASSLAFTSCGGEAAKDARVGLKEANAQLKQIVTSAMAEPLLGALNTLLTGFSAEYRELKRARGLLDFDDLQEKASELLRANPALAQRYRRHFKMIMVDEFQDTNELQMSVLEQLRDDDFCVVGDERQSIYGFRYAEIEIFDRITQQVGEPIELKHNFRSHPAVLGFINDMFSGPALFGSGFMRLEAGRTEGWEPLPDGHERIETVLVDIAGARIEEGRKTEASIIAEKAAALVAAGRDEGDIAILVRSSSNVPVYAAALERAGLPVYVAAGQRFHDALEVNEMLALLRVVALPLDDGALANVLAGRLVRLSDDALLTIRNVATKRGRLFEALRECVENRAGQCFSADDAVAARNAYESIQALRAEHGASGLPQLIHRAIELFDYDLTVYSEGMAGVRAWANLMKLARFARAFEQVDSSDPGAFVEHMRRQSAEASREAAAATETGAHAVRIMTIHGSKGLEFPVVFVADLGVATTRGAGRFLVGAHGEGQTKMPVVGVKLPDDEPFEGAQTLEYQRLAEIARVRAIEEEKRCLYVACTRAQEMLVLSAARDLSKEAGDGFLVDWVRQALGDPSESGTLGGDDWQAQVVLAKPAETAQDEHVDPVAQGPMWVERERAASAAPDAAPQVPPTVSYSRLHQFEQCPYSYYTRSVLGLRPFEDPSSRGPRAFGSAVHAALQGLSAGTVPADVMESAAITHGLDVDARDRLERAVATFQGSELARRISGFDRIDREHPLRVDLGGGTSLVGSIDLLARNDDAALVVDYKTGRGPSEGSQRAAGYELQARCYALAALRAGARAVDVVFVFVEHEGAMVEFTFTSADADTIAAELRARVAQLATGEFPHLDAYDPEVCAGCAALGGLCPVNGPLG